ncbi:MAG: LacI family DNA-binding transcriptional regulator [Dysosmobacter sp.]|jgi:LacI family transcriptional regulator|uniref:LacI family DNA-binding transcriptional regulator n=1 Tax=Dysosmobacter sp. TaxID=2591382 RepID=UPI003D8F8E33
MGATIKQIAEIAGVSTGTVDRAIHGRGRVNPEVSQRILDICKALNYKPNKAGRHFSPQKQQIKLGFICSVERITGVWASINQGIQEASQELREYNITVETRQFPLYLPEVELALIDELIEEGVKGLVIAPLNSPIIANRINELISQGFPIVFVNSEVDGCSPLAYVGSNYLAAGRTAAGLFNLLRPKDPLNLIVFYGTTFMMSQHQRVEGLSNELDRCNRSYKLIGPFAITADPELAYTTSQEILCRESDANAIFTVGGCVSSVCQAILDTNLTQKVVHISYDISPTIKSFLSNGSLSVAIGQEGVRQGYQSLKILADYLLFHIKPDSSRIFTHSEIYIDQNS